jgi:hypothetical protein
MDDASFLPDAPMVGLILLNSLWEDLPSLTAGVDEGTDKMG